MKLSIASLIALAGVCLAHTFNTSDIIKYNVTRGLHHSKVDNSTDYDYWSLAASNYTLPIANGSGITVALIGDGVNPYLLSSNVSVDSVFDINSNKTYKFSKDEITDDTLAAKVLLANAPEATIKSYKIFESKNSTRSDEVVLADALVKAANDDDVDFILLNTWQIYGGWASSYFSQLVNDVADVKPVVIPMGETNGMFQFSDGAGAEKAISVGGSGFAGNMGYATNINDTIYPIYATEDFNLWTNNTLILGELDSTCYLKNNISYDETDILFLDVGNCTSTEVTAALVDSNFTQLLTTGDEVQYYDMPMHYYAAMLLRKDGFKILEALKKGETIVAHDYDQYYMLSIDTDYDEFSINFNSSSGPTLEMDFKPNVIAQMPFYFDDIEIYGSGTGLSAAYVAGTIAAYASTFDDDSWTDGLIDRVTTSGMQVNFRTLNETYSEIHNPAVQGGGIFNPLEFLTKEFNVSPGFTSLGETNSTTKFTFNLTNDGTETKRFHIAGLDAITIYSVEAEQSNGETMYEFPTTGNTTAAEVAIDKSTVSVGAGKSKNVTVVITPPDFTGENARLPVFGGYIQVTDLSTNQVANIPYIGTTAKMENVCTQTFTKLGWKIMKDLEDGINMHVWADGQVVNDTDHYLQVYYGDIVGAPIVDLLILNKEWTKDDFVYPPVAGENNFVERPYMVRNPGTYPWHYVPRTNTSWIDEWDLWHYGRLADNTIIPNGDYKLMLRILRHGGNESNYDDWYNHVSPWFTFNYENVTEVDLPSTTLIVPHSSTTLETVSTTATATVTSN